MNAGISIASQGFMLRFSPRENRTMFIAAGTAVAGCVGGLTAIGAGWLLSALVDDWDHGRTDYWTPFHVLFAASLALRFLAIPLAAAVREPGAATAGRLIRFLVGSAMNRTRELAGSPNLADEPALLAFTPHADGSDGSDGSVMAGQARAA
jgi:MFS family permease